MNLSSVYDICSYNTQGKLVTVSATKDYQEALTIMFEQQNAIVSSGLNQNQYRAQIFDRVKCVLMADGVVGDFDSVYLPQIV